MTNKSHKVLVLGADCRAFLAVARSLGRYGLEVHTAWCPIGHPALASRYIRVHHDVPGPDTAVSARTGADLPSWVGRMSDLLERERYDLVIPCNDPSILPLEAFRELFERSCPLALLNEPAFQATHDKQRTIEIARGLGIALPESELIRDPSDLRKPISEYQLPIVIKPISSFAAERPTTRRGVRKLYQSGLVLSALEDALEGGPVLFQENFVGIGVGVEILAERGELRVVFQHERVHEPLHGGGSSYRRSAQVKPDLRDATERFVRHVDYHGVGMFEYKVDTKTGDWVLIEVNGRFWGSLPLAMLAGVDFPKYLYQMLVEGRHEFPSSYRAGLYCRNLTTDLEWIRENFTADKSDPSLCTKPVASVFLELFNLLRLREGSDTLVWDDPQPGIRELAAWSGQKMKAAVGNVVAAATQTKLGRFRLRRRVRRALRSANSVAFVCFDNIYRSPFAAAYARSVLRPQVTVVSCGTGAHGPLEGRQSPAAAVLAALEFSADISAHRALPATADLLKSADVVFVFDRKNFEELTRVSPIDRGRLHWLGAVREEGPLFIEDPAGHGPDVLSRVYTSIAAAVDEVARAIQQ